MRSCLLAKLDLEFLPKRCGQLVTYSQAPLSSKTHDMPVLYMYDAQVLFASAIAVVWVLELEPETMIALMVSIWGIPWYLPLMVLS